MADIRRLTSSVLLAIGVLLVFTGLNAALGFTPGALVVSGAVIAALIYTGAVWFAPRRPPSSAAQFSAPTVFDRDGVVVSGPARSRPLSAQFPESVRADVTQNCAAVFAGVPARLAVETGGRALVVEFLPVRSGSGVVVYGLVVTSEAMAASIAASA
jgi:hypothetical protein